MLACCIFSGQSCIEREDGCLDPNAQNFNFNADRACDTCCIYPRLSLVLSQKWGNENFQNTDTLYDINQQPYYILDLKYLLSSFRWIDTDGNVYTVDSAGIKCGNEIITYSPDLLLIDSRQFNYVLDSIKVFPAVQRVLFNMGWDDDVACVDPSSEDIPGILSDESPLWDEDLQQRAAMRVIMQRDTSMEIFDTVFIQTLQPFDINYEELFTIGQPQSIRLSVNYEEWFGGFDVNDLNGLPNVVIAGIPGSITRTP